MAMLMHRDSKPWQVQIWVFFLIAVFLGAVALACLPSQDPDRAFMVMVYFFCLITCTLALAKTRRDRQEADLSEARVAGGRSDAA